MSALRVVVHDYSGHPGQVDLSRALARRGHRVVHQHCPSYVTGTGALVRRPDDPATFSVEGVALGSAFARYAVLRRVAQELRYGALAARAIRAHRPDVALLSNIPLLALVVTTTALRRSGIPVVFWQQDVYSAAISAAAVRRLGPAGRLLGAVATALERSVARRSAAVVPIDASFLAVLHGWGVPAGRIQVLPNWAPLAELPVRPKDNAWSRDHGLAGTPVVLYTGTLGLKHDPSLLVEAAAALGDRARVVVVSEGRGRALLERERSARGLSNLSLLDFQPYRDLPDIMGSADVLVALLEPEASTYSVPSKVLSYLCAGRPVVAVIPPANSAARILREQDAGRLVEPGDGPGLVAALDALLADPSLRAALGGRARRYAEATFDSDRVATRFEAVLRAAARHPNGREPNGP